MFSNNFVVSVEVDGEYLKEKYDGSVVVPFGSEYSVFLKNKNDRRATAEISIDGTSVGTWVIGAKSSATISRPADKDVGFKFVRPESSASKRVGKDKLPEDYKGILKVEWKLEYKSEPIKYVPIPYTPPKVEPYEPWVTKPWTNPWRGTQILWMGGGNTKSLLDGCVRGSSQTYSMCSVNGQTITENSNKVEYTPEAGVTVDGAETGQKFGTTYCYTEQTATIMTITLRGVEKPKPYEPHLITEDTIRVGDIVKLKSGGPTMTISSLDKNRDNEIWANCHWFDNTHKYDSYPLNVLVKLSKEMKSTTIR